MIWKKVKKLIIPLGLVKLAFLIIFITESDLVSISRDLTYYTTDYSYEPDNDSLVLKKQKLIRIVRNENEPGISIKLRGKRHNKTGQDRNGDDLVLPVID